MKIKIISLSIAIIFLIISATLIISRYNPTPLEQLPDNTVIRVIDGDTFEIATGDKIRILCIDTPEQNEEGYEEATRFLEYCKKNVKNPQIEFDESGDLIITEDFDRRHTTALLEFVRLNQ